MFMKYGLINGDINFNGLLTLQSAWALCQRNHSRTSDSNVVHHTWAAGMIPSIAENVSTSNWWPSLKVLLLWLCFVINKVFCYCYCLSQDEAQHLKLRQCLIKWATLSWGVSCVWIESIGCLKSAVSQDGVITGWLISWPWLMRF